MDAKIGDSVVFVVGSGSHAAVVTRAYGDEKDSVDLRYFDEEYRDPAPDPRPDDWKPGEPRADHVNVTAVPHASHTSGDVPRWQVTAVVSRQSSVVSGKNASPSAPTADDAPVTEAA